MGGAGSGGAGSGGAGSGGAGSGGAGSGGAGSVATHWATKMGHAASKPPFFPSSLGGGLGAEREACAL